MITAFPKAIEPVSVVAISQMARARELYPRIEGMKNFNKE